MNFNLYISILEDLVRFKVMNNFHPRNLSPLKFFTLPHSTIPKMLTFLEANLLTSGEHHKEFLMYLISKFSYFIIITCITFISRVLTGYWLYVRQT